MANGFLNYSEAHRCPICDHPDWCTYTDSLSGGPMFICMRIHDYQKGDVLVSSVDHQEYECKGPNKSGNLYFYLKADCDRWREERGYKKGTPRTKPRVITPQSIAPVKSKEPEIEPLPNEKLHYIYYVLLCFLKLEDKDRAYLHQEGFTDEMIEKYMIRTLPEDDNYRYHNKTYHSINPTRVSLATAVAKQCGDLTGVPGFYKETDKNGQPTGRWNIAGLGGILFPLFDIFVNLYRLRIRVTRSDIKTGKYRNVSSSKKITVNGVTKNKYLNGCSSNNNCGIFFNEGDDFRVVFITEGEKKAIIGNEILKKPFITLPGVNSHSKLLDVVNATANTSHKRFIDFLKEKGTKIVIIAFDADKNIKEQVLKCEEMTFQHFKEEGFTIGCADWDMAYGKGIDDLLVNGHLPTYHFVDV